MKPCTSTFLQTTNLQDFIWNIKRGNIWGQGWENGFWWTQDPVKRLTETFINTLLMLLYQRKSDSCCVFVLLATVWLLSIVLMFSCSVQPRETTKFCISTSWSAQECQWIFGHNGMIWFHNLTSPHVLCDSELLSALRTGSVPVL